jgi:hypothetical protein
MGRVKGVKGAAAAAAAMANGRWQMAKVRAPIIKFNSISNWLSALDASALTHRLFLKVSAGFSLFFSLFDLFGGMA